MSLRMQLLAFSALTLVLPWAGFRFVQEMETALRGGLESSLLASARTVSAALDDSAALIYAEARTSAAPAMAPTVYAAPLDEAIALDGVRDDWSLPAAAAQPLGTGRNRFWAGVYDRYAYLYLELLDDDLIYQGSPGQRPFGDRVVLGLDPRTAAPRWLVLMTGAPGVFRAQRTAPGLFEPSAEFEDRVLGAWRETANGFAVEVRIPLDIVGGALGLGFIDVDAAGGDYGVELAATWGAGAARPGPFVYQRDALRRFLRQFSRAGDRFRVLDDDGWVLSDVGDIEARTEQGDRALGFSERLLRFVLRREDPGYESLEQPLGRLGDPVLRAALNGAPAVAWFSSGPDRSAVVAAAVPIETAGGVVGAVLLEQASDSILTLTNQALMRLMAFTVVASLLAAVGLVGFAAWLSFRVRRLARAAESALGPKGEIDPSLPGRGAGDEIGDLARSFADLLRRLKEHTQYLRTLTSKLSHELRTPLAIVSTSADNLEHEIAADPARTYLSRLRDGAKRLDSIVVAMSEATRMELAIGETVATVFDLGDVVDACAKAYADVYPDREIICRREAKSTRVRGAGELIAQLMDKLIDNAVGFSSARGRIEIVLADSDGELALSVTNAGPQLPDAMRGQLFESLVSFRTADDGRPHLGLGLYIVALIADFHGARVEADNLPNGRGVIFTVRFPKAS
jgi:two-component system, OmpR family, sensor histidine kinase ChvG